MNYNQNHKIAQITESTLIVGIDIAKDKHVARAQDYRGIEFGKRLIFENRIHGYQKLLDWVARLQEKNQKTHVMFGVEPTGHFWKSLAYYLNAKGYDFVLVNPMHVKKAKSWTTIRPQKMIRKTHVLLHRWLRMVDTLYRTFLTVFMPS
ncbi:hypothetical protein JNUCC1_03260 [Lentibacillus sp. JNUCC-1]|nr:hypothetical protein [Lentibacillus sp. JNUCC-1]